MRDFQVLLTNLEIVVNTPEIFKIKVKSEVTRAQFSVATLYSPVPNNKGGRGEREGGKGFLIKRNLNINKRGGRGGEMGRAGVQIKEGGLKIVLDQKWQPVTTNYGTCFG